MKRTALKPRSKPLPRTNPLKRGAQLARNLAAGKVAQTPPKTVARRLPGDTGPDRKTRKLVLERDGYSCVCCGRSIIGQQYSIQHRKRRSQGGTNSPANLITLLGSGTTLCHGRIDSRIDPHDEARGYTVRGWREDPATVPVMLFGLDGGITVWLDDAGHYLDAQGNVIGGASC